MVFSATTKISMLSIEDIRRHCRIPSEVRIERFDPEKDSAQDGDLIITYMQLQCVQLPLHPIFNKFFNRLGIRPNQFNPNTFRILSGLCMINIMESNRIGERQLDLEDLFYFYDIHSSSTGKGDKTYHLRARNGDIYSEVLFFGTAHSDKHWQENIFKLTGAWGSYARGVLPVPIVERKPNPITTPPRTKDPARIVTLRGLLKSKYTDLDYVIHPKGFELLRALVPTHSGDFSVDTNLKNTYEYWMLKDYLKEEPSEATQKKSESSHTVDQKPSLEILPESSDYENSKSDESPAPGAKKLKTSESSAVLRAVTSEHPVDSPPTVEHSEDFDNLSLSHLFNEGSSLNMRAEVIRKSLLDQALHFQTLYEDSKASIEPMRNRLKETEESLESANNLLKLESSKFASDSAVLQNKIQSYGNKLVASTRKVLSLKKHVDEANSRIEELKFAISVLKKKDDASSKAIEDLSSQLMLSNQRVEDLTSELASARDSKTPSMQSIQIARLRAEVGELKRGQAALDFRRRQ